MDETLWHKFTQHLDLKEELLETGNAELVEVLLNLFQANHELTVRQDSDKDAFWGIGADRRGRNELGKALERLRTRLREA
jgi:diaminohydroxyphosphoribosylaminopyrimidine deaminase/5-amino-6-(5-phosphoribosylamino)uracil reductase